MTAANIRPRHLAEPSCPPWCNGEHALSANDDQDPIHETALTTTAKSGGTTTEYQILAEQYPVSSDTLQHVYVNRRDARGRFRAELSLTLPEAQALTMALNQVLHELAPTHDRVGRR
jgi:hypothetical protein